MGLFDRLKKAFRHDKEKEQEELKQEETAELEESSGEIEETSNNENKELKNEEVSESTEELIEEVEESEELSTNDSKLEISEVIEEVKEENTDFSNEETKSVEQTSAESNNDSEIIEEEGIPVEVNIETEVKEDTATEEKAENEESSLENGITEELKETEVEEVIQEKPESKKYDKGLEKTRKTFGERLNELFANFRRVDEDFFDELEETLIMSDVGFETSIKLTEELRNEVKLRNVKKPKDVQNTIIEKLVNIYEMNDDVEQNQKLNMNEDGLTVILFVGVNGAGKTTTIGKLANKFKQEDKKVLLAAADTFRAGAINQLIRWGERSDVPVVAGKEGGDPAAVVFDAVKKAKSEDFDVLLVDTAGRLQNKENLMRELNKIKRVIQKEIPEAPHEVLLVIDATTGQNALVQAKKFNETTEVTGLVLTKLDGTAKGGIILAIRNELKLPVKFVGLGEKIDDLAPFDSEQFIYGLFKDLWVEE